MISSVTWMLAPSCCQCMLINVPGCWWLSCSSSGMQVFSRRSRYQAESSFSWLRPTLRDWYSPNLSPANKTYFNGELDIGIRNWFCCGSHFSYFLSYRCFSSHRTPLSSEDSSSWESGSPRACRLPLESLAVHTLTLSFINHVHMEEIMKQNF